MTVNKNLFPVIVVVMFLAFIGVSKAANVWEAGTGTCGEGGSCAEQSDSSTASKAEPVVTEGSTTDQCSDCGDSSSCGQPTDSGQVIRGTMTLREISDQTNIELSLYYDVFRIPEQESPDQYVRDIGQKCGFSTQDIRDFIDEMASR